MSKFDVSAVVRKFNNNQCLLLSDIAQEYGWTEDELITRLEKGASRDDEATMVRQAIKQNDRRRKTALKRQQGKKQREEVAETAEKESIMKKNNASVVEQSREERRVELQNLRQQIDEEMKCDEEALADCLAALEDSTSAVSEAKAEWEKAHTELKKYEAHLDVMRQAVEMLGNEMYEAEAQYKKLMQFREKMKADIEKKKAELSSLDSQIAALECIYLIAPNYKGDYLHLVGRKVSTIELPGVEYESHENDLDALGLGDTLRLIRESGSPSDLIRFSMAYEFAMLVLDYQTRGEGVEVKVLNDDAALDKLIELVAK